MKNRFLKEMAEQEQIYQFDDQGLSSLFQEALQVSGVLSEVAPPSWLGDDFHYLLGDFVGRGGSGFVWQAQHHESSQTVALKIIPLEGDLDVARERWLREAEVASSVKHPHLLGIHEKGLSPDGESAWIALEWIAGSDLHRLLAKEGRLTWLTLFSWLPDLCDALAELHSRGLVHRDLKPSNFLLEESTGRLIISDFGAALPIEQDRVTRTTDTLVSFGYAAPEQLKVGREIDGRADQYSLATTLWELLTGELPMGSYPKLRSHAPDSPSWLDAVLRRAMSASPNDRYPDIQSFSEALTGRPSRRKFLKQATATTIALAGAGWGIFKLSPDPEVITLVPKTFQSGALQVVEGLEIYIQMKVTIQPDGFIPIIVVSRSDERWRGLKTRGAFALLDEDGAAIKVILSQSFGVNAEIVIGNGDSRADYLETWITPEEASRVDGVRFMAYRGRNEEGSPWFLDYPETPKVYAKGTDWHVDRKDDAKKETDTAPDDEVSRE